MNLSPGMLSVWCALGTVIGLAFFIIGLFIQRKTLRTGGILFFAVSFAGLLYLIANHGQIKKEQAMAVSGQEILGKGKLLMTYESVVTNGSQVIGLQNQMQSLPHPLYISTNDDSLFLMHGNRIILSRGMRLQTNEIELTSTRTDLSKNLFTGHYNIQNISSSEWRWTTEYEDEHGLKYFDELILTTPRPIGQKKSPTN